jgi:hypothetical protein
MSSKGESPYASSFFILFFCFSRSETRSEGGGWDRAQKFAKAAHCALVERLAKTTHNV